jgi:speckle-type POZ protein
MGTIADGDDASPGDSMPFPPLPLNVRASYNDHMKEMIKTGRGWHWKTCSWPHVPFTLDDRKIDRYADFQLILEFKDSFTDTKRARSLVEGERQVLNHFSNLLDSQSMTDVTFVVKNEKIGAHLAVVSGSPVICTMLEEDKFKEGRTKVVEVDDIEAAVFREMLRYLYTGKAPKLNEDEMTLPLFIAADKYQIQALKDLCEQSLICKLKLETAVTNLVVAHLYTAPQLLEASLKFMDARKKELWTRVEWKELHKHYSDVFFMASQRLFG